jgi:LacI family transcriptional regulator
MATMKEVADRADVSVATVSRVINKTGYVSPDLQERVVDAMRALKYQPSALARSLRRQETRTIGVLVPQLDSPFFSGLAFAIEKSLFGQDYRTLICSAEEDLEKEDAYIEMLLRQRVDGVILVPTGQSVWGIRQLVEKNVPVVLLDRDLPETQVNKVLVNNFDGALKGMNYLLQEGHRVIGVIGAPTYSQAMLQRIQGVRQALQIAQIEQPPELFITGTMQQFEMGFSSAMRMLEQPRRPTAIFALTDVMAVGAMHAIAQQDLRIPDDISVMGFDNIPLAQYVIPGLTTVAQPIYEMGEKATCVLLSHIGDQVRQVETVYLETSLMIRQSVASPA